MCVRAGIAGQAVTRRGLVLVITWAFVLDVVVAMTVAVRGHGNALPACRRRGGDSVAEKAIVTRGTRIGMRVAARRLGCAVLASAQGVVRVLSGFRAARAVDVLIHVTALRAALAASLASDEANAADGTNGTLPRAFLHAAEALARRILVLRALGLAVVMVDAHGVV